MLRHCAGHVADGLAALLASPCVCALQTRALRPTAPLQGRWPPRKGAPDVSGAAIMLASAPFTLLHSAHHRKLRIELLWVRVRHW